MHGTLSNKYPATELFVPSGLTACFNRGKQQLFHITSSKTVQDKAIFNIVCLCGLTILRERLEETV